MLILTLHGMLIEHEPAPQSFAKSLLLVVCTHSDGVLHIDVQMIHDSLPLDSCHCFHMSYEHPYLQLKTL